jgi:hypothetical protein
MTDRNKSLNRTMDIALWVYLIIVPFRLQFGANGFVGIDSPFHARYASIVFTRIFARTFPTTAYSIWNQRWGDKEFLFHAYLAPFCLNEDLLQVGSKIAAGLLFGAVLCSIAIILRRYRVPGALWWAALLPALSSGWDYRMLMVRSHLASILLILWILYFFEKGKIRPLVVLTFVYTWTYTAPYFAVVMCGFMALGRLVLHHVLRGFAQIETSADTPARADADSDSTMSDLYDRQLLFGVAAATLAGMIIHPQMPNQLLNTWMHLSLVATRAWGVAASPVELGSEFQSETLREAYILHPGVLACLAFAWMLAAFIPAKISRRSSLYLWMTVPAFALYGLSGRFIEYLGPLAVLALALVWSDARVAVLRIVSESSHRFRTLLLTGLIASIICLHLYTIRMIYREIWHQEHVLSQERAGRWLAANAHPGDLVVPLDWTQFPSLYFNAPKLRYVVGLEPTTMQVLYPEKLRYLEELRLGKRDLEMNEFKRMFPDARYVIVWANSGGAAGRLLTRKKYTPVYADAEDLIYDVDQSVK